MKSGPVSGVGIAATTIGGILVYSGVKGYSILQIIGNLVSGKPLSNNVSVTNPLSTSTGTDTSSSSYSPPTGGNQSIGQELASQMGWDGAEWTALQELWNRESGWNNHAKNASSGAYGIPQALPYTKMPKLAWPESAGGKSDPTTQIQWGLNYIKSRYGSPSMAWAHEQANSWY